MVTVKHNQTKIFVSKRTFRELIAHCGGVLAYSCTYWYLTKKEQLTWGFGYIFYYFLKLIISLKVDFEEFQVNINIYVYVIIVFSDPDNVCAKKDCQPQSSLLRYRMFTENVHYTRLRWPKCVRVRVRKKFRARVKYWPIDSILMNIR